MSIWYSHNVTVFGDEAAIAKCFGLNRECIRTDSFKLSFAQKNGWGIDYDTLSRKNPDLIFLIETQIECDYFSVFIQKFDTASNEFQSIPLETYRYDDHCVNRLMVQKYEEEFPHIMKHHKKNEPYNWNSFLVNSSKIRELLSDYKKYEVLSYLIEDDFLLEQEEPTQFPGDEE